jgi:signal transduction histidine kinase
MLYTATRDPALEDDDALEVRLPASVLERFTALLVANPPLPLMIEETFAGLEPIFDLDCALLYRLNLDVLEPIAGAGRGALADIGRHLRDEGRAENALWRALDSGVALFADHTGFGGVQYAGLALLPLPGFNGAVRGALVFGRVEPVEWRLSQQRTLIAASRVIAVNLERSLEPRVSGATHEGVALSNLARLLDGVHSERELRAAALEVLRPHLAGVSLAWLEHDRDRVRVLEFDGNEALEAGLRAGALPDDHLLLEALDVGRYAAREGGDSAVLGVSAWCAMPARSGLTLLAMRQSRLSAWSESEQRLLHAACKTLGACCTRLGTIQALTEARSRAEFLAGLSDALQTASTPEEVSHTAMALLGPNVRALNILTMRLKRVRGAMQVIAMGAWGELPPLYEHYLQPEGVPLERTKLTQQVFETRQPHYDAHYIRRRDPEHSRVALGLEPIMDSQGQVLAVFSVGRDPAMGAWDTAERELLARAAATVGLALERAEVRQALEASRHRAQALASLSNALQNARTAEEVAANSMELLGDVLHAQNIITLKIEDRDNERFLRSMGVWGDLPEPYGGYFQAPGVNINATQISKRIVETGTSFYDTDYVDPATPTLETRHVSVGLEPIKDAHGNVIAIFSVGRDAQHGEWTAGERELMTQAAMTIGLAIERTRNREELEARAKALEDKSAEMEAFVFSVSHDLKSPMVSLEGMSTLLEEAVKLGDGTELEFFVSRLRANVQTMTGLVGGLLELSRIGRVEESLDCVNVGEIVHTVIQERMVTILANRITVDTSPDFPFVTYSPERLYQLFSNLIGNAIKFLPDFHPSPRIEVGWRAVGDELEFSVADNGRGIPNHLKSKSLELFSRLEPSIEGTGVGLAMVKRILDYNEGKLRLEDTPGGGLTVVFTVPRTRWVR